MKRSLMAGALLAALGNFSGIAPSVTTQEVRGVESARAPAAGIDRAAPKAPRVSSGSAVQLFGGFFSGAGAARPSYLSGRAVSAAEQKRRAAKAKNRRRHKRACGMRGRSKLA